jgi:cytochrome c oxidase subunit 3
LSITEINPSIPFRDGPQGHDFFVDPMPAPKLGMWLFLASEMMFFIGLLGSFIVLESAGAQHQLFVNSSHVLSKVLGIAGVIMLLASSAALHQPRKLFHWIAVVCAVLFLIFQTLQWSLLKNHLTTVYRRSGSVYVSDGPGEDRTMPMPQPFDIHGVTPSDFRNTAQGDPLPKFNGDIVEQVSYGPGRNNFFAMYFLMSTAHVLHLMAGILAVLWFMLIAKGKLPAPVQIYWHFVNAVGVIAFVVLYFV